jgi:hypothetical protein
MLWWKYLYWRTGIPARVFNQEELRDVHDIIDIHNAISSKSQREQKVKEMISKMSRG